MTSIGDNIKKYRKYRKLTQKQLGEKIDKKEITIRRYESGDIEPPIKVLLKISETLEIPYLELIKNTKFDNLRGNEILKLPLLETFDIFYPDIKNELDKVDAINLLLKEKGHNINDFTEEEYNKIEKMVINCLDIFATIKKNNK